MSRQLLAVLTALLTWTLTVSLACAPAAYARTSDVQLSKVNNEYRNLRLTHLGSADGLTQELVNAIAQDAHGFMWFGTQEGLTRYDGNRMQAYMASNDEPGALQHSWIWALLSDSKGRLWVGTNGGGLALYQPRTDNFRIYRHNSSNSNSISSDRVRTLFEDRLGRIWIGTQSGGLDLFDPDLGRFEHFTPQHGDPTALPGPNVTAIAEDSDGNLWVGTAKNGLARLDPVRRTFTRFAADSSDPEALADNQIRNLYADDQGRLWVATDRGGLHQFNSESQSFIRYQHDAKRHTSLPSNLVRDVHQDHNGDLWVATDAGLAQWLGGDSFIRYQHDPADRNGLNTNPLTDLFEDRTGNLWIGSYDGVDKWNYVSDMFTYFDIASSHLENELVTALAEANDGVLWIGSYGGGLTRFDRANSEIRRYQHDPSNPDSLSDNRIMALALGKDDTLWVGTRGGGLNRLNTVTGVFESIDNISANAQARGISALMTDPDGTLWVAVYGGGLTRIAGDQRTFHSHDSSDPQSVSTNKVLSIFRDRLGQLWIGTEDGGLNALNESSGQFTRYQLDPNDPTALQSNTAWQINETSDGSLWIGTLGAGLSQWPADKRNSGRFELKHFDTSNGLVSDSVLGLLEDNQGYLWLSSNTGLTRFDPRSGLVRQFDSHNGLRGNEFMQGVALRSTSGKLYFGSSTGVVSFSPANLEESSQPPAVAVTAKSRDKILARGFSADTDEQTIELSYPYYYLSFDFAALDFVSPDKNQFRYQLEGFENQWLDPADYPRATYTNLAPGSYDFKVKGANSIGLWNEKGVSIRVQVIPPPWRSNLAYALYGCVALLLIGGFVRRQRLKTEQSEAYKRELEDQVQARTQELAEQNHTLADLNEKLTQASLTDPLTGLRNRRYFYEIIKPLIATIERHYTGAPVTEHRLLFFMMIDLDGFKAINDSYGHHAGDAALSELAQLLIAGCRDTDTVCRWGGDEFLIVGEVATPIEIEQVAERLRRVIDAHPFKVAEDARGHMSASIGLCTYPLVPKQAGLASWEVVSKLADQAAYIAKTNGKNRWVRLAGTAQLQQPDLAEGTLKAADLILQNKLTLESNSAIEYP
ncbi:MAG: two-component regulator propeller domain-containing protein [Pseudomonadales bacterium]